MTGMAWLRRDRRRLGLGLILAVSLGIFGATLMGGRAAASGETGGSPTGTGISPTGTGTSNCPSSNPPNQMTLVAGTPQTAILQSVFATGLQAALTNSNGCPVTSAAAGVPVTFSAPPAGASGVFSSSGSNTVTVGADASGAVAAPTFTANDTQGSYTLTASSQYGSVSFSLTNAATGIPARITTIPLKSRSATVMTRYPQPLQVEVLDANGNPVAGTTVTFTLGSGGSSACGTTSGAGASFAGGGAEATATTSAAGVASSPLLSANRTTGSFTATAAASGKEPSGGSAKENSAASGSDAATPVSFSLANLAGKPSKLATGAGTTQSTTAGTPFPIRLAVTVTDAEKNPVPHAQVTFSAPTRGAAGRFADRSSIGHSHGSHHRRSHTSHPYTVKVTANACGIAVAPAFTANHLPGGYIVTASVTHSRPAAFALVNEAPGQSS
jgi:protocatechuate 3,4-dioxygenase beta subunit